MLPEVEAAIVESLRKRLKDVISPDKVSAGDPDGEGVWLVNREFTVEDTGIGGSYEVKSEEYTEKFDADGEKKDFKLSKQPVRPLVDVQSPPGTKKNEPDDYSVDYPASILAFREAPKKEKDGIMVSYKVARASGEIRNLKFDLIYDLFICAKDKAEKDSITLEAIKALFLEKEKLSEKGVEDLKFLGGSTYEMENMAASLLTYEVGATVRIEIPMGPMDRIEIKGGK